MERRTYYSYPDASPFEVWARRRLRMPRIPPGDLNCSVYLYNTEEEAARGYQTGGSGFWLTVPCTLSDRVVPATLLDQARVKAGKPAKDERETRLHNTGHCYLVTNRHVWSRFARINQMGGGFRILDLREELWVAHPDGDDVSICSCDLLQNSDDYACAHSDRLLTEEAVKDLGVGPGDEVFMIGRFINHEGQQQNLPSVRFGHIAMMPAEPIRTQNFEWVGYMIEAYSFAGYSGSPVPFGTV